ncbi:MAG: hypothetical protein ACYDA3_01140 [Gaiellaceae bacterium]
MRSRVFGVVVALACACGYAVVPAGAAVKAGLAGGVLTLDSKPFFPLLAWSQCAGQVDANLALGINVFLAGQCNPDVLAAALAGRAYLVTDYLRADGADQQGVIGYHQLDEPDGYGISPAMLPSPLSADLRGRVVFETLTYHFSAAQTKLPWAPSDLYPAYIAKSDVIGFDLYPRAYFCGNRTIGLASVFDEQRELTELAGPRMTFQWIEVNDLQNRCGAGVVTPATIQAESWLAIAGGANGLGFFTHGGPKRPGSPFFVPADNAAAVAQTTAEVSALAPVLLGRHLTATFDPAGAIRAGVRRSGDHIWVIAVNTTTEPVRAAFGVAGCDTGTATVWNEIRAVDVTRGQLVDAFAPLAVHVYELDVRASHMHRSRATSPSLP